MQHNFIFTVWCINANKGKYNQCVRYVNKEYSHTVSLYWVSAVYLILIQVTEEYYIQTFYIRKVVRIG